MSDTTPERIVICNHSEHGPMWFTKQPDMPVVFFGDAVTDEYIRIDLYGEAVLACEISQEATLALLVERDAIKAEVESLRDDNIRLRRIVTKPLDDALADSPPLI